MTPAPDNGQMGCSPPEANSSCSLKPGAVAEDPQFEAGSSKYHRQSDAKEDAKKKWSDKEQDERLAGAPPLVEEDVPSCLDSTMATTVASSSSSSSSLWIESFFASCKADSVALAQELVQKSQDDQVQLAWLECLAHRILQELLLVDTPLSVCTTSSHYYASAPTTTTGSNSCRAGTPTASGRAPPSSYGATAGPDHQQDNSTMDSTFASPYRFKYHAEIGEPAFEILHTLMQSNAVSSAAAEDKRRILFGDTFCEGMLQAWTDIRNIVQLFSPQWRLKYEIPDDLLILCLDNRKLDRADLASLRLVIQEFDMYSVLLEAMDDWGLNEDGWFPELFANIKLQGWRSTIKTDFQCMIFVCRTHRCMQALRWTNIRGSLASKVTRCLEILQASSMKRVTSPEAAHPTRPVRPFDSLAVTPTAYSIVISDQGAQENSKHSCSKIPSSSDANMAVLTETDVSVPPDGIGCENSSDNTLKDEDEDEHEEEEDYTSDDSKDHDYLMSPCPPAPHDKASSDFYTDRLRDRSTIRRPPPQKQSQNNTIKKSYLSQQEVMTRAIEKLCPQSGIVLQTYTTAREANSSVTICSSRAEYAFALAITGRNPKSLVSPHMYKKFFWRLKGTNHLPPPPSSSSRRLGTVGGGPVSKSSSTNKNSRYQLRSPRASDVVVTKTTDKQESKNRDDKTTKKSIERRHRHTSLSSLRQMPVEKLCLKTGRLLQTFSTGEAARSDISKAVIFQKFKYVLLGIATSGSCKDSAPHVYKGYFWRLKGSDHVPRISDSSTAGRTDVDKTSSSSPKKRNPPTGDQLSEDSPTPPKKRKVSDASKT